MPNLIFGMNSAFPRLIYSSLQLLLLIYKNQPKSQGFKESKEHYMLQIAKFSSNPGQAGHGQLAICQRLKANGSRYFLY